jgi:hypothetical protein
MSATESEEGPTTPVQRKRHRHDDGATEAKSILSHNRFEQLGIDEDEGGQMAMTSGSSGGSDVQQSGKEESDAGGVPLSSLRSLSSPSKPPAGASGKGVKPKR